MKMKGLTEKQRNILDFIEEFMDTNAMAPTVYEIAEHFRIKTSTVFAHVRALQRKNCLVRSSKARSISLNKPRRKLRRPSSFQAIPLVENLHGNTSDMARANAGKQFFCDTSIIGSGVDSGKLYAMRVSGSAMRSLGILDGDIAIIKRQTDSLKNGDIVVACVDGETAIRTCHQLDGSHYELIPSSPEQKVISGTMNELPLQGVVVGLQRSI